MNFSFCLRKAQPKLRFSQDEGLLSPKLPNAHGVQGEYLFHPCPAMCPDAGQDILLKTVCSYSLLFNQGYHFLTTTSLIQTVRCEEQWNSSKLSRYPLQPVGSDEKPVRSDRWTDI